MTKKMHTAFGFQLTDIVLYRQNRQAGGDEEEMKISGMERKKNSQ